ncbi:MAG: transposase [Succinivibrionaceae bacterium]|nr:transposase [Succinivibrionaceae bacterium]
MYIQTRKGKASTRSCMLRSYRANGICHSEVVEKLGTDREIMEREGVTDALAWAQAYARARTEEQAGQREDRRKAGHRHQKSPSSRLKVAGTLIAEAVFHLMGIDHACGEIMALHPRIEGFDLTEALKLMVLGTIADPTSKLGLSTRCQRSLLGHSELAPQHLYRALDLACAHMDLIMERVFQYTSRMPGGRDTSRLYYDCTNFYCEVEQEDCDSGRGDSWGKEHTLRKYGKSKEHRPNPIVQMGLMTDADGIPVAMCVNPGNTSEQVTLAPLEAKVMAFLPHGSGTTMCTDSGLASRANRELNNRLAGESKSVDLAGDGERHFVVSQSIKGLKGEWQEWALDPTGWSYAEGGRRGRLRHGFGPSTLTEGNKDQFMDTLFFKERTISDRGLDQRLVASFSLKYREFLRALRAGKAERAGKIAARGDAESWAEGNPKSLIKVTHVTPDGQVATRATAEVDLEKIAQAERFDGFYCHATNLFAKDCSAQVVMAISGRRWEIEESFRIMKSELRARPMYHSKDSRIKAHLLVVFLALTVLRLIERQVAAKCKGPNPRHPNGRHTMPELLRAIRTMRVIECLSGKGYEPDYDDSPAATSLLEAFELGELAFEQLTASEVRHLINRVRKNPRKLRPGVDV